MNPFDDYTEADEEYERPRRRPTCRQCGKLCARWEDDDGRWVLMESAYKVHRCDPAKLHATMTNEIQDLTK